MDEPLFNELLESVKQADQIMTDNAELRRLAEAAEFGGGAHEDIEFSNQLDFHAACTPAAILALLDEIDGLKAENDRLRQGMKGDYDIDAWLDWSKEKEQIKAEIKALRRFAAEAYQVLGALDAPENVLDNASDAANGLPLRHETLLPFFADDYESMQKDAARYRWLRERDLETIRQGGVFAGMTPENIVLNQEDLDAEIDAALEGATQ
ncbi:TPA: ead/Ea22-like family protein [Pseudomonas aeruginosa]